HRPPTSPSPCSVGLPKAQSKSGCALIVFGSTVGTIATCSQLLSQVAASKNRPGTLAKAPRRATGEWLRRAPAGFQVRGSSVLLVHLHSNSSTLQTARHFLKPRPFREF